MGRRRTQRELLAAFALIEPVNNWKLPIDAVIKKKDLPRCEDAAIHFTGGGLRAVELANGKLRVTGEGYYKNVGA